MFARSRFGALAVVVLAMAVASGLAGASAHAEGAPGGYWAVALDGGVFSFGGASFWGSASGVAAAPVVGLAPTPSGRGYWAVALDGGVFSFGDAGFYGSASGVATAPVVGLAPTPSGRGYWLLALDGGVFSFGDAGFHGSAVGLSPGPFVAMAPTPSGRGYWVLDSGGGVFTFGDAGFFGAPVGRLGAPASGITPTATGQGYWVSASDGTVFAFGDAPAQGSATMSSAPVVGVVRPGGPASMGGWLAAEGAGAAPGGRVIALTFDDGPDPGRTPELLATLARLRVPATFFVLGGYASRYPQLVKAEEAAGHSVQNHTWSHADLRRLDEQSSVSEIDGTERLLGGLVGVPPRCLRPPFGRHDGASDTRAARRGLRVAMWNVDPRDWSGISPEEITRRVLAGLQPVSVVVLHDRTAVVAALPDLVAQLRARGYRFSTICQTSGTLPGTTF